MTGTIIDVFPTQTFNKGFRKREFVIECGDKYPQKIIFGLVQDKCDMIDSYSVGDIVTVGFDVKGRDWTDKSGAVKYFNTLEAFRISGQQRVNISKQKTEEEEDDDIFESLGLGTSKKSNQPAANNSLDESLENDDLPW